MDPFGRNRTTTARAGDPDHLATHHLIVSGPTTTIVIILALISAMILVLIVVRVSDRLCWRYLGRYVCLQARRGRCTGYSGEEYRCDVTGRTSSSGHSSALRLDPPGYEEALHFPRVDSSTIKGIPPPKYASLTPGEFRHYVIASASIGRSRQSGLSSSKIMHLAPSTGKFCFSSHHKNRSNNAIEIAHSPFDVVDQTSTQFRCYSEGHVLSTLEGDSGSSLDTPLYPVWRESLSTPDLRMAPHVSTETVQAQRPDGSSYRCPLPEDGSSPFFIGSD